jgi:PAS domain S-box-containing protein
MKTHRPPGSKKWLIEMIATAIIYYGAARLGLLLAFQNTNASPVWPPSGIAFAMILLLGYRVWPGIIIGAFLANVVVFLANKTADTGSIVAVSSFIATGNTLEAVSGAFLLHRFVGFRNPLNRSRDVFIFVSVALLMCLVSSTIGPISLCLTGIAPWSLYRTIWFTWWLGDTVGILVLTPFLLSWYKLPLVRWRSRLFVELVLFLVLLFAVCQIVFGRWFPISYPQAFILIPFIVWAAFRFGQSAVVLSTLLVSGVAIWGTIHGSGPFVREMVNEWLWLLQSFVGIVTVTGLVLAAVLTERKRVEEVLRDSEERYRALYEDNPSMYFTVDSEGKVLSVNKFGAEQLGYTAEELVGQSVLNVFYEDDKKPVLERVTACLQNPGQVFHWEFRKVRKDGSMLWVREVARAVCDTSGNLVVLTVCEDITERKRAEERFHLVIESAPNGLVMADEMGKIILVNSQAEKLLGYGREELIGQSVDILVPERIHSKHSEYRTSFHAHPQARSMGAGRDLFALRKDGTEFPVEIGLTPIQTDEGVLVLSAIADITERKRTEETLAAERERLAATLRSIRDGVIATNPDGHIILANSVGQRYLALLADAGIGDVLTHLGEQPIGELLSSPDEKIYHEVVIRHPPRRIFEVVAQPMESGSKTSGWVIVIRDSTEERSMQQRMVIQERLAAVGQLAAGIAHNFNNALTVVVGFSQLLLKDPSLSDIAQKRLDRIIEQVHRASHFASQILDFSRQSVTQQYPLDLLPLLKENVELLEHVLLERIKIIAEFTPGEYWVSADPVQIFQVLVNLALNALDAMPEGGELKIQITRICLKPEMHPLFPQIPFGNWIRLSVSDTGVGIASEHIPYIFEPFFTTKEVGKGSGLGLAQVYGIVKQHNGFIDATIEVGKGTTFTIYLPAIMEKEVVASEAPEKEEAVGGQGKTILLAGDNLIELETTKVMLEKQGYRVLITTNGYEALEVYDQHRDKIALVIMDMVMPEMDGLTLFQSLKERNPDIKALMIAGYLPRDKVKELLALGIEDWIQKPINFFQLTQMVDCVLDKKV